MHLSSVVLPQPDGPTTQTNSPSSTENETFADRVGRLRAGAVGLAEALDLEHRHRLLRRGRAPAAVPGEHAALDEEEEER